jgi:tetratricopeptide (TPR) repeat protein
MSDKPFDINAQGYARVNAIGQLSAENVDFGDRFIGQQRVAVIGLDPIVPEHVAAKWIDRRLVQAELLGRIEAQAKLIELVAVGGFGKSLLATWLFHQVKDGFDRSLWLNFRKVPTFNEFARWVLQEIGFLIDDPRVTNEALITELVYRLTEKRCLLVLDQLEAVQESPDLESFGEFLRTWRQRGHKSVVVITTRSSNIVATEANDRLDLAGFTEAEGADFLCRQGVGAEEAGAMETLVQVAEGHPFLLNLAASWLRQEAGGMIDQVGLNFFAGLFRRCRKEAKVEELFRRLFEDLPERLQRLLLGVVVYRDAFGLEMARVMLSDVGLEDLRSLVSAGFLAVKGDRWFLHPLTGNLIKQELRTIDRHRESHQKAISYFTSNIKQSAEIIKNKDCTEELEIFYHHCELGEYALANRIMNSCVRFLEKRGYYLDLLPIYEQLTLSWSQTDAEENKQELGWAWTQLGILYYQLGHYQSAITTHQQAQIEFKELNFSEGMASSLGNLGIVYQSLGDYQKSIYFHQQSLAIQHDIGDINGEASSLCNLGCAYFSLGNYQKAIYFHQQSLAIRRDIGDINGEASSLCNLGSISHLLGDYQKAVDFQQQSLTIYRDIGYVYGESFSLMNLGTVHHSIGKYQKAIDYYHQSLSIQREISDPFGEAGSLNGLGNAYRSIKEYQKAIDYYQESLAIQQKICNLGGEVNALGNLGSVHNLLEEYEIAVYFQQKSLVLQHEIGDRNGEALSCHNLSLIYQRRGQFGRSRSYRLRAYRIWQELQLPLAALPLSDLEKRIFQYLGGDWIEQRIHDEQKLVWFQDSIGLIIFIIRWFFSPIRWIRKRLRSKK